tara:strand:- start:105 stop:1067 length:963 start_codon:yes stop_codon:yes gene_type:complete
MKNTFIIILLVIFSINISLATNFIKGETYRNNVKNVFGTKMMVSFPPGKWEVKKIVNDTIYSYVDFKNVEEGAWFYIAIPNQNISGDYFRSSGVKKCQSDDEYKVHATGLNRSQLQTSYCIKSDSSWLVVEVAAMKKKGNPLFWGRYLAYYPVRNSNADSLDKRTLDRIGKILMNVFKNNIRGKSGSYSGSEMLMKTTNYSSSSTSSTSPTSSASSTSKNLSSVAKKEVCFRSTKSNGLGWEDINSKYGDYVKEAFNRKLSLYECRKLTDRFPKVETVTETLSEESSVKDKLKELKSMLDEGLINQELYDTKSAKLLEDF